MNNSSTPDTDAAFRDGYTFCREDMRPAVEFCANLERERDSAKSLNKTLLDQLEAKDAELDANGLVLQKLQDERDAYIDKFEQAEKQLEAMREAIKEACEALADLSERWEETPEWHNMAEHNSAWCGKIFTNVRQCKKSHDALAKLQPFFKP